MTNEPEPIDEQPLRPAPLSFDALQRLCAEPINVDFLLKGQHFRIVARRLMPFENTALQLMSEGVQPPIQRGKTEADDRIGYLDAVYRTRRAQVEADGRALAVFWAVDDLQKLRPDLVPVMYDLASRSKVLEFVNGAPGKPGALIGPIVDLVFGAIQAVELSIPSLVNFPSPAGAEQPQP